MKTYNWYLYGTPGNYRVTELENARRYVMDANKTRKVCAETLDDAIGVCRPLKYPSTLSKLHKKGVKYPCSFLLDTRHP